jgi:DHA2 family multidrug resistance protein
MILGAPTAKALGFFCMVVGAFMAILDIQIVASSLAEIQAGIGASQDEISWIQTSYLIAEIIMIPLTGWLARVFSTRWLFVTSAVSFTIASAACAVAWNLESMIAFRVVQGFLGGAMIPTIFATAYVVFPRDRQPMVTAVMGLVITMAPTIGPTLGGWLTDSFSWHWLFLVNMVPGLMIAVGVAILIDVDRPNLSLLRGFDLLGIILVAVFLGSLQFVLEEGAREDWLESDEIIAMGLAAIVGGIGFLWRELTVHNPVVDLRAFTNKNFSVGCLFSVVVGIGIYGSTYLFPVFLASIRGFSALQIGVVVMTTGMFQLLSAPIAAIITKKLDMRIALVLGLSMFCLGTVMTTRLTADWGYDQLFVPQALRGFSLMLLIIPINTIALGTLSTEHLKTGTSLYNLMRNMGGALGLAVINTLLGTRHDLHYARLSENITAARQSIDGALQGLTGMLTPQLGDSASQAALGLLASLTHREASVMAFSDVLVLMAGCYVLAFLAVPLVGKIDLSAAPEAH